MLYIGPVQVPGFSPELRAAHPEWLRVKPGTDRHPNFGNIRNWYGDWLCDQLAYVVRTYHADGFWFDGAHALYHLHSYDTATERQFAAISGGKAIPKSFDPVHDPVARQYLAWHQQYFVDFADRMRNAIRKENADATIWTNYSANRTWYYPQMYMGEYPAAFCRAVDVCSVELYWDVPGDVVYQQFCYAFLQGVTGRRGGSVWIKPSCARHLRCVVAGRDSAPRPRRVRCGASRPSSWNRPDGKSTSNCTSPTSKPARNGGANRSPCRMWASSRRNKRETSTRKRHCRFTFPTCWCICALFEKHWPIRVMTEYDLEDGDLHGVRVLVLPDVACLSDRAAEVVRRFVANGGGLVAKVETSLYDQDFKRRSDFALADVFHARYVQRLILCSCAVRTCRSRSTATTKS